MLSHRIDKYSRQIVCQDIVLSCQSNNIEEIPLFKCARINKLSLREHRAVLGELSSVRDLDLSGMLVNWHLWNQRGVPLSRQRRKISPERARHSVSERRERVCESSLTLRKQGLCIAIEKYLLFLMPRDMKRKRVLPAREVHLSRRDLIGLSAFYVDTAYGLCQYLYESGNFSRLTPLPEWNTLSLDRIRFPDVESKDLIDTCMLRPFSNKKDTLSVSQKHLYEKAKLQPPRSCVYPRLRACLSLYCPSILNSPDIQDIAQSGYMSLQGNVTLELS